MRKQIDNPNRVTDDGTTIRFRISVAQQRFRQAVIDCDLMAMKEADRQLRELGV